MYISDTTHMCCPWDDDKIISWFVIFWYPEVRHFSINLLTIIWRNSFGYVTTLFNLFRILIHFSQSQSGKRSYLKRTFNNTEQSGKRPQVKLNETLDDIFVGISCRTVALWKKFLLTDWRATVPPIVKTVYLLHRKSCTRFRLNFSIFLLCQVKIPGEKILDMFIYWENLESGWKHAIWINIISNHIPWGLGYSFYHILYLYPYSLAFYKQKSLT